MTITKHKIIRDENQRKESAEEVMRAMRPVGTVGVEERVQLKHLENPVIPTAIAEITGSLGVGSPWY
jgi:hypothetical protein